MATSEKHFSQRLACLFKTHTDSRYACGFQNIENFMTSSQNYASAERSYKIMTEEAFASLDKEKPRVTDVTGYNRPTLCTEYYSFIHY
jgi:hypothetical protein